MKLLKTTLLAAAAGAVQAQQSALIVIKFSDVVAADARRNDGTAKTAI